MRTYPCVVGMYGARSAVFVRTGRVLPITSQATRNLFVLEVSTGTVTCVVSTRCSLDWYRVSLTVSLKTNRTNKYAHVPMCRKHVWRTVRSVCAYGAHVAKSFPSNS